MLAILSIIAGLAAPVSTGPEASPALPVDGVLPLDGPSPAHRREPSTRLPADGAAPFDDHPARDDPPDAPPPEIARPLGIGPPPPPYVPFDPKAVRLVRIDFVTGAVWRIREADTTVGTSVELGRMHGLSASFHTEMIVVSDRDFVRAFDFPIGVGGVARGRLRDKPLYGSVGLSTGILVHRAATTSQGVIHRVDPDFRLPIRLAWTIADLGLSLAVVPAYSVRERVYERRGAAVLRRHPVRVGLVLGLHWDLTAGRAKARRPGPRRDGG